MASISDDKGGLGEVKAYDPYVPEKTDLKELTFKAVITGVLMAMILGAANAYLGLKAGITVAATFPAAVVGMAVLRFFKGSILEENVARTTGSVGEALAAGAIFTIPAFLIANVWESIDYVWASLFMLVGGLLGVMFVILLRRILVEESGLPFPESVAASQIHIAGQAGATGAAYVFGTMALSGVVEIFKNSNGLQAFKEYITIGSLGSGGTLGLNNLGTGKTVTSLSLGKGSLIQTPSASPALWGVGYIIGPRLASINFSGGVLGWLLLVPLIMMFSPGLSEMVDPGFERVFETGHIAVVEADYLPAGAAAADYDEAELAELKKIAARKKFDAMTEPEQAKLQDEARFETMFATGTIPVATEEIVFPAGKQLDDYVKVEEADVLASIGMAGTLSDIEDDAEKMKDYRIAYNAIKTERSDTLLELKKEVAHKKYAAATEEQKEEWSEEVKTWTAEQIWFFIVRPFAVGAMLVGAAWTLWGMRKQLTTGIGRAVKDLTKAGKQGDDGLTRYQRDLPFKLIFLGIGGLAIAMGVIYTILAGNLMAGIVSALVMTIAGFFFAAVAGYLVGLIGSSNNPISGLTLSTLIIAALLLVMLGIPEDLKDFYGIEAGAAMAMGAVLGVASVICCSCGVAGDMMQDLKVGHMLGGTPWRMEASEILGVIGAALVMALPLMVLHSATPGGIGGPELPAPQAGLMAMLSKGIITGEMAWPLIILGMFFSVAMILIKSPSPMLIAIGMYLPLHTTSAIFVGGLIRFVADKIMKAKKIEGEAKEKVENTGTLLASGFIAGEALMAIILAGFVFGGIEMPSLVSNPGPELGILVLAIIGGILVFMPLKQAKKAK